MDAITVVVAGIGVAIYIAITFIMLRNIRFHPALRYSFCLTTVPVFVGLLFEVIALINRYAPAVMELVTSTRGRGQGFLELFLIIPIPVAGCWLWYLLFRQLDRAFSREP